MLPYALCQQTSPLSDAEKRQILESLSELKAPTESKGALTDAEKRTIILQLIELKSCRVSVKAYEEFVARIGELSAKEKEVWERALEVEKRATAVAEQERDLARDQAGFYKAALDVCRKQPGFWCRFYRLVSLGLGRCQ